MKLIKIGGGRSINTQGIIKDLAKLNEPYIIVHGANAWRDELAEKLGIEKKVVTSMSGYASVFSDENAIQLIMMAYAGLRNKQIVECCQQNGINAVGLSGLDGRIIQGKRNAGIRVYEAGKKKLLKDFSGKPQAINQPLLELLLQHGYIPVLCIPIIDEFNTAINSENDDIVNVIQAHIKADTVIQLIEAPGFLKDSQDENSLIERMTPTQLIEWESRCEGRIKRKLLALKNLIEQGTANIIIADGRRENPVADALAGKGTVIR
jgi:acetylglutamate/LysW-gamma-L-alpha-aminoadipate kinase